MLPTRLQPMFSRAITFSDIQNKLQSLSNILSFDWGDDLRLCSNLTPSFGFSGSRLYAGNANSSEGNDTSLQRRSWQHSESSSRPMRPVASGTKTPGWRRQNKQQHPRDKKQSTGQTMDLFSALDAISSSKSEKGAPSSRLPASIESAVVTAQINSELLPLLDYILTPQEIRQLSSGKLSLSEHRGLLSKVRAIMERSPGKIASTNLADLKMLADPNYRLEDSLVGSKNPSADEVLSGMKEEFMAVLGLDESEFEELKSTAVQEIAESLLPEIEDANPEVQNQQLEKLLTATMTPSHQHYAAVAAQLKVLQSNSYWPHEKKLVFARRLLRQLA